MAVLTADRFLVNKPGQYIWAPVKDNVKIYKGSLVCYDTTGYATLGADTASFVFAGVAVEQADNTVVGHTAGGISVKLITGTRMTLPGASFAQTSVGAAAYVADTGAVSLTATNYVFVGQIIAYNSATSVDVNIPRGGGALLTTISGLTATAGELNRLASVTAGTTAASKALVVDASKALDVLTVTTETITNESVVTSLTLNATAKFRIAPKTNDTYGAAIALDVTISNHVIAASNTTSATATITPSAAGSAGDWIFIDTVADATGTVTVTFAATFHPSGTQATTASHFSSIAFKSDGTRWIEQYRTTNLA